MLSKYFEGGGSAAGGTVVEPLVRVYDSLPVYDAISVKNSVGTVVKGKEKEKGFWAGLKSIGRDFLKDVMYNATGISWDDFRSLTGLKRLGEYFAKKNAYDLSQMRTEDLQELIKSLRKSDDFENAADLIKAFQQEIDAQRAKNPKDEKKQRKSALDAEEKSLKDIVKQLEEAKANPNGAADEEDVSAAAIEEQLAKAQERLDAIESEKRDVDAWDPEADYQKFIDNLTEVAEKEYETSEGDADGSGAGSLPWPVLTDLEAVAYGRVGLPKGRYLLSAQGVSPESVENYTVQWVIEEIIDWNAYKEYCKVASQKDAGADAIDDAASLVAVSTVDSDVLGTDFMSYVLENEVSGDFEASFGFMPARDMSNSFIAVVNSTNNAFSIFTPADLRSTMLPVVDGEAVGGEGQ